MKFNRLIVVSLILISIFTVFATAVSYYYYPPAYGGTSAFYRRYYYTPDSQKLYFGDDWSKPLGGFGSKGTSDSTARVEGGSKGYNSPTSNLETNSFTSQGRNPNKISNWDPRFRGYSKMDKSVSLEPITLSLQNRQGTLTMAKGTARLVSQYGFFGSGSTNQAPTSEIYFQSRDLPPLGNDERYELWLFDEDYDHSLSLGLLYAGIGGTGQFSVEIYKPIYNYDYIGLTREPYPDYDPSPNKLALIGKIDDTRQIEVSEFIRSLT